MCIYVYIYVCMCIYIYIYDDDFHFEGSDKGPLFFVSPRAAALTSKPATTCISRGASMNITGSMGTCNRDSCMFEILYIYIYMCVYRTSVI